MFRGRAAAAQRAAGAPSCCARDDRFGTPSSGARASACRFNHLQQQRCRLNVRKKGLHSSDKHAPSRRSFGGAAKATTSSASATEDHDQQQQKQDRRERTTKRHGVTTADFARVIRALLWLSPPSHRAADPTASEAAAEVTGTAVTISATAVDATTTPTVTAATATQQAQEGDSSQVSGDREKGYEPRTSLDLSGHSFGKVLQVSHSVHAAPATSGCLCSCPSLLQNA